MSDVVKPVPALDCSCERHSDSEASPIPTDSKVKGILEKVGKALSLFPATASQGALLAVPLESGMLLSFLSRFSHWEHVSKQRDFSKNKTRIKHKSGKYIPIGLQPCSCNAWMNSFMQLFLFLPGVSNLFPFLPKSLEALREFSDQYYLDQKENRNDSLANTTKLVECFKKILSPRFFKNPESIDLYEVFLGICELVVLKYESKLIWDLNSMMSLSQIAQKFLKKRPQELLVSVRGKLSDSHGLFQKQISLPDSTYYDLDAFIEYRPDGHGMGEYIAYLKCEGTWYQCDDARIRVLRSSALSAPLSRSVLLHYKKI